MKKKTFFFAALPEINPLTYIFVSFFRQQTFIETPNKSPSLNNARDDDDGDCEKVPLTQQTDGLNGGGQRYETLSRVRS